MEGAYIRLTTKVISTSIRIGTVLDFVRTKHDDPTLDLQQSAATVRMSAFHLTRLLKRETGFGFVHHLRAIRIEHAERLLRTTTLSVKEVAAAVGYSNTNALERNFRILLGTTPTVYRRVACCPQEIVINSKSSILVSAAAAE